MNLLIGSWIFVKELVIFQTEIKIVRLENEGEDTDGNSDEDSESEDSSDDNSDEDKNAVRQIGQQEREKLLRAMKD